MYTRVVRRSTPAVKVLLVTSSIDGFIQGILLSRREIVLCHSLPVAILTRNQEKKMEPRTQDVHYANRNNERNLDADNSSCVRATR